jgi:lysophospholipase L1-like esterase/transcriptional regulator with XRE-family HTH domain
MIKNKLIAARKQQNKTQKDMANLLFISQSQYQRIAGLTRNDRSLRMQSLFSLFCLLFFSTGVAAQQASGLGEFEKAVSDYVYRSIDNPPVPGCTLFAGSSSFTLWKSLEETFANQEAVNRGFGGSKFIHNIAAIDKIHLPYHPSRVVIFCGTNDIASGKEVDSVFADFKYYIARFWNKNPLAEIYYVSISHAPSREKFRTKSDQLNTKIEKLAYGLQGLYYIDIVTPMNGKDGNVRQNLFKKDKLHPNAECYDIWAKEINKALNHPDKEKSDVRALFKQRKTVGLFSDPRFITDNITIDTPSETDVSLNIVFIGNSITIGGGEQSPPARCAEYLKKQACIANVQISNQGVSGYTTVDFLPSENKQFPKVIEATDLLQRNHPEGKLIFSIMLGTNDSAITGPNGSPVSPEDYRKNMKEIVDNLLNSYPDCQIVLHRPIWYSSTTHNSATYLLEGQLRATVYGLELDALIDYYAAFPSKGRVLSGDKKAYHYFKTHHKETMIHETGGDGTFFLHPNESGNIVLGRFWGAAILDVINQD